MASHAQIQRNLTDFANAWARFQRLVAHDLPHSKSVVTSHTNRVTLVSLRRL